VPGRRLRRDLEHEELVNGARFPVLEAEQGCQRSGKASLFLEFARGSELGVLAGLAAASGADAEQAWILALAGEPLVHEIVAIFATNDRDGDTSLGFGGRGHGFICTRTGSA